MLTAKATTDNFLPYMRRGMYYLPRPTPLPPNRSSATSSPQQLLITDFLPPKTQLPKTYHTTSSPISRTLLENDRAMAFERHLAAEFTEKAIKTPLLSQKRLIYAMASAVFAFGITASLMSLKTNKVQTEQVKALKTAVATTTEAENPTAAEGTDESPPNTAAVGSYKTAPDLPKLLTIGKLGVSSRVRKVGINKDGNIAAPASIFDTGWYEHSVKPGEPGVTLIDGHVHGPTQPGVFVNLKKLVAGDIIKLEKGNGEVLTYKVVKSESMATDSLDLAKALTPAVTGINGLNLITCDGKLKPGTTEYQNRLIVYATQI